MKIFKYFSMIHDKMNQAKTWILWLPYKLRSLIRSNNQTLSLTFTIMFMYVYEPNTLSHVGI